MDKAKGAGLSAAGLLPGLQNQLAAQNALAAQRLPAVATRNRSYSAWHCNEVLSEVLAARAALSCQNQHDRGAELV